MKLSFVFLSFFFSEMTSLLQTQNGEFKSSNYKMKIHSYGTIMIQGKLMHFEAGFVVFFTTINCAMFELLSVAINIQEHFPFSFRSIKMAVEKKACNCLLLKVNQIGSVTESIEA